MDSHVPTRKVRLSYLMSYGSVLIAGLFIGFVFRGAWDRRKPTRVELKNCAAALYRWEKSE